MKAYRLAGWKKGGHTVEVDTPKAGPGQVLIRMGGAGICHSDLHIMHEWAPGTIPDLEGFSPDFTLGHENAGQPPQGRARPCRGDRIADPGFDRGKSGNKSAGRCPQAGIVRTRGRR